MQSFAGAGILQNKCILKISQKFTRKHMCWCPLLIKLQIFIQQLCFKKRHQHRCFPVNFAKIFKNTFFTKHLWSNASFISAQKTKMCTLVKTDYQQSTNSDMFFHKLNNFKSQLHSEFKKSMSLLILYKNVNENVKMFAGP